MPSDNPLTLIYDALWELVERNTNLAKLIKLENRIKFDKHIGNKRNISSADTPELSLFLSGLVTQYQNTSSTSRFVPTFTWGLASGDLRIDDILLQLTWEFFRASSDWDRVICGLQWNGVEFVKRANVLSGFTTMDDDEQNRGIRGWSSLYSIEVDCHIPTNVIRVEEI